MVDITASMVKELREKTGAGMMDCKRALAETNGDKVASIDWLRTKGISNASRKAGREAAEGLIGVALGGAKAVIIEMNSETDYVARSSNFQDLVRRVAAVALSTDGSVESISSASYSSVVGVSVEDEIKANIATIGENIKLRRSAILSVDEGVVAAYVHGFVSEGLGKIGVLVALKSSGDKKQLNVVGTKVAMHIVAASPLAIHFQDIDPAVVARERNVFIKKARDDGKPEEIIEKIVDGKMQKFFNEVVLLSQSLVMDPDLTVADFLKNSEKSVGAAIEITGMVRFNVGRGN